MSISSSQSPTNSSQSPHRCCFPMWRRSCGADTLIQLPAATHLFAFKRPVRPPLPPPRWHHRPSHTQLPPPLMVADLSGTRSLRSLLYGTRRRPLVPYLLAGAWWLLPPCLLAIHGGNKNISKQTLIGLVDVLAITQLLTKTEGHWKMYIAISLHHIKCIWNSGCGSINTCFPRNSWLCTVHLP